jgi:molybdate transport system permease protein
MAERPARRAPGWSTLQATFTLLAGALLMAFLLPLLAFLPDVDGGELARQVEKAGLARSLAVSGASATLATLLAALGGVPLGYLLARDRVRFPWVVRTLVLIPLVLPPVAAGVLLLNVYGPGGLVGGILQSAGWTLVNAIGGIVIAQVFITAPFVVLTAEAAFRAVDPRLEAVGATLGRTHGEIFRRISLPLARYGLLAGLALAWMRAAGEFGATVSRDGGSVPLFRSPSWRWPWRRPSCCWRSGSRRRRETVEAYCGSGVRHATRPVAERRRTSPPRLRSLKAR